MALTNSRPLQIPALQNEILHNTASPIFQANSLVFNPKHDDMSHLDSFNAVPNTPSSEGSPNPSETYSSKNKKDGYTPKRDSSSLEISKIVPVTGERPLPSDRSSPLDDDVLYAVFVILWEKDPESQGMTVKQLSDFLLEKHPEMNNLSTKLSNLISAKLNAYVKKLEKGEKTLTYALSREWSNSSPRRMVYVYRGILSSDYKKHAQAAAVQLKQQQQQSSVSKNNARINEANSKKSFYSNADAISSGQKGNNGLLTSTGNLGFSLTPEFNIPYSTSPVSAMLTPNSMHDGSHDFDTSKKRSFQDSRGSTSESQNLKKLKSDNPVSNASSNRSSINTSVSNSANLALGTTTYITAAAAAPRLSKFSKNGFKGNSQNSAGLVAAIHKAISTQTPIERSTSQVNGKGSFLQSKDYAGSSSSLADSWIKSIREGFLTDDIDPPESMSFEDLEYTFD